MHNLLTNPTLEIKVQLLQAMPGCFPEKILREWNFLYHSASIKEISESYTGKIIELRLNDTTMTFHYETGSPCFAGYLFPDYDEHIEEYKVFFKENYLPVQTGRWLNPANQCILDVIDDEDVGAMICCTKNKVN